MGKAVGKKVTQGKRGKLIAAFCSAINDNGRPEGRETFRWLRKDVALSSFSLVTPHPPLFLPDTARSAYSQFLSAVVLRRAPRPCSAATRVTTTTRVIATTMR